MSTKNLLPQSDIRYHETVHYLEFFEKAIKQYWDKNCLNNYRGEGFTYGDVARMIAKFHLAFEQDGIKKGDKIAICAKNSARWGISFLSVISYEAVIVPILADFHPDSVNKLVDHSDSVVLFTDKEIWDKLDIAKMPKLRIVINNEDYSMLYARDESMRDVYAKLPVLFESRYPMGFSRESVQYNCKDNIDNLAIINYTSGTTSDPKGVMLTYRNLSASVTYAVNTVPPKPEYTIVSMLPMAHIYGLVFEFLYPVCGGASIYFLGKTPSPSVLLKAMKEVRPYLVLCVPLVMEKVYKSAVKPALKKPFVHLLYNTPLLGKIVCKKIRKGLDDAFGGRVQEYIMGGAALNPEVEKCFRKIRLHYMVGYGLTEAAPLLGYAHWYDYAKGSCGKAVTCATVRIDSEDPEHIAGEIQAKGENLSIGYYRNPVATKDAFTPDGFFRTGDLGVIDSKGNIYIKGRIKNLILSANGQNIYPEEVESIVNSQPYVSESVVVSRAGKLVALVDIDKVSIRKDGLDAEAEADIPETVRLNANKELPAYSQITKVEVVTEPFQKTPKMSIKRFLYK